MKQQCLIPIMSDNESNPRRSSNSLQSQENVDKSVSTVPSEASRSLELDTGIVLNQNCCRNLFTQVCSREGLNNPVVVNIILSIVLGIPLFVVFMAYAGDVLRFVIRHDTFFIIAGGFLKLLGKIVYSGAVLPIGTLHKFVIGTLNIESNALVALIYQLISAVIEVLAFIYHRNYGKLPEAKELEKIKEKLKLFRQELEYDDNGNALPVSFFRKVFEIFCIQNAWVPDTATMLYFATATNWSVLVFLSGTLASNLTIGLLKTIAWMIALRAIIEDIEQDDGMVSAWDLLEGLSFEMSLAETILIYTIGVGGVCFVVYRFSKFLWLCCLRRRWQLYNAGRHSQESRHECEGVELSPSISVVHIKKLSRRRKF